MLLIQYELQQEVCLSVCEEKDCILFYFLTDPGGRPGGSKTAKKGCKKLVLFSTGGQQRRL